MDLNKQNESSSSPFELQNPVPSLTASNNENEGDRHSQFENFLRESMLAFWQERRAEIYNASDIRSRHPIPLARIRRIMKSNEKVERTAADATILLGKACEIFIMELTCQAWLHKEKECRTLHHWDVGRAISSSGHADFLSHVVRDNSRKVVMKNLKEAMFASAYPLQLQDINPPEELKLSKETDPHFGTPMHSPNRNPPFLLESQEIPQLFPPSTSSEPLNSHPYSQEKPSKRSS